MMIVCVIALNVSFVQGNDGSLSPEDLLRQGVRRGNLAMVTEALEKGVSPNIFIYDDKPLLSQILSYNGQNGQAFEIVQALFDYGLDISYLNGDSTEAFSKIQEYCWNRDIIKILVEHGLDIDKTDLLYRHVNEPDMMRFLIDHGADVNHAFEGRRTALHNAAELFTMIDQAEKQINSMKLLIEHGADVNARDNDGFTPLLKAAGCIVYTHNGPNLKRDAVRILIEHGADVNAINSYEKNALAVCMGSQDPQFETCELLADSGCRLPLDIFHGVVLSKLDPRIAILFVQYGAPITHSNDYLVIIRSCAEVGNAATMESLLQHQFSPTITNERLTQLFKISAESGNTGAARVLVKNGAEASRIEFKFGDYSRIDIEDLLPETEEVRQKVDPVLNDDLYLAVVKGHHKQMDQLLEQGADPNYRFCFHEAVKMYDLEAMKRLVMFGARLDQYDKSYLTPLMHAVRGYAHGVPANGFQVITWLVDQGANVNAPISDGTKRGLILSEAVKSDDPELVAFLLAKGADPSGINPLDRDRTPVFFACDPVDKKENYSMNEVMAKTNHKAQAYGRCSPYGQHYKGIVMSYDKNTPRKQYSRDILRQLVQAGADVVHAVDTANETPLYEALELSYLLDGSVISYLIDQGCPVNKTMAYSIGCSGQRPLIERIIRQNILPQSSDLIEGISTSGNTALLKDIFNSQEFSPLFEKQDLQKCLNPALTQAVRWGNKDTADFLIDQGADIGSNTEGDMFKTSKGHQGKPLFHSAVYNNQIDMAKYLLDKGVDIHAPDEDGLTPLYISVTHESVNADMVRFLADNGADVNQITGDKGWSMLMHAAKNNKKRATYILLKHGADPMFKTVLGKSVIDIAVEFNHSDIAALLSLYGADISPYLQQPKDLMESLASSRYDELFKAFVEKHGLTDRKFLGPALIRAIERERWAVFDYIIKQKPNLGQYGGQALAIICSMEPEKGYECLEKILTVNPPLNLKDKKGNTPLIIALYNKKDDEVRLAQRLLMEDVDVNVFSDEGVTPLMITAAMGNSAMVRTTLGKKAHVNTQFKVKNRIKYFKIYRHNFWVHATTLFRRHQEFKDAMREARYNSFYLGDTALMYAAASGNPECVDMILQAGAKIHTRNHDQSTALLYAAGSISPVVIERLIIQGADPFAVNREGINALMMATMAGQNDNVVYLLDRGLDIDQASGPDRHHRTALMFAAIHGKGDIIKTLIDRGCNTDIKDDKGNRAIDFAEDISVKKAFLDAGMHPSKNDSQI